ncbi:hypothetical protein UCRPA7_946 [Phaeoacremonium minimum UCRPA7]|uniref:MICOS complex subunit MIC12 n=1 Tax=Phaeoacremonium minimum (strain UCR-PA7) TaxID=1286976 RepID=R8BW04_PHAM7|nr:hypothetical protein UCRPA7_946 [Phaeoacremonium minimum UCRPA7]EOO03538.1 hypothetical protein UCRPA7_946 [Phaeoacremonium minimum UCRPA7]
MGFTTGFTGGVTVTLGIAYLTVLAHQRNRERQADILRAQTYVLNNLAQGPASNIPLPPPSRSEQAALARANFVETAKDRWNAEIEGAVRWAQTKDWDEVRDEAEGALSRLWSTAFGASPSQSAENAAERVKAAAVSRARETKEAASGTAGSVSAAAKSALEETKVRGAKAVTSAEGKTQEVAAEAKGAATSAFQRGLQKGKEIVGKAKAAVGVAEEKLESRADAAIFHMSDVEKALQQRYEKSDDVMKKSIDELLDERYTPIDKRDNTKLRGI